MTNEKMTIKELCLDLIDLINEGYGDVHLDIDFIGEDFKSLIKNNNVGRKSSLRPGKSSLRPKYI